MMDNGLLLAVALLALVAAGASCGCVVLLVRLRREQGQQDLLAQRMASLEASIEKASTGVGSIAQWAAAEGAAAQQRYESLVRESAQMGLRVDGLRRDTADRLDKNRDVVDARLGEVRATVERQLEAIRQDNATQLDRMRQTVDEKLSRTLNDRLSTSFREVSKQLEAVYTGLGDMRSIAAGVGDLKRVLSNVKTRGILGEVQLGAILADILTPEQYAQNVATKPGSADRVEFAVKLPQEGAEPIWLPIDSKFPGDAYEHLRDAVEAGDAAAVESARRVLEQRIKLEAKDISSKYLSVPATTNFAILFLPFEGLYAEVVDRPGLIETLQRDYQVSVAGPSTMAVILNSLQMSYQTFAFQKRADEIQRVLAAVKAEFPKYQAELRRALKQIETAGKTVDGIINTRTNVIERKLRSVTAMEDQDEAATLLGIEEDAFGPVALLDQESARGEER
ncbi:DNA recombination protein RmuC [Collinsella tanakaei]|uniref:DNA recombination protein RmuC n=1 Tax=Collinsella tanakaei TaxID=626935 RepID=UPI00294286BF|nr:DNA recombination protein RmuC [Collinsella tanakaei]